MTNERKPAKLKLTLQAEAFQAIQERLTHDLGVQVSLAMAAEMSAAPLSGLADGPRGGRCQGEGPRGVYRAAGKRLQGMIHVPPAHNRRSRRAIGRSARFARNRCAETWLSGEHGQSTTHRP